MTAELRRQRWADAVLCLVVAAAWVLLFARTMDRDLNHDEHQFLAPAALVSREGLQPWRDFPLYHLPNLVFAYAAADRLTGDLVFGAKLLNFLASATVVGMLALFARKQRGWAGAMLGTSAILLLLSDPLFRYTAGKTWNHEIPTALLLIAAGLLVKALERDRLFWTALAGVAGGLAAGCRLTFAPTLAGLFLFVLLAPLPWRRRAGHALALTLAATAALGPSLYYLATETDRFVFCNFEFPRLRLSDPTNSRVQKTASLARKLRFFWKEVLLPSWPIFALWIAVTPRAAAGWWRNRTAALLALSALLLPFLFAGCFAPARYQLQHFFVFIPVVLLGAVAAIGSQDAARKRVMIIAAVALLLAIRASRDYAPIQALPKPEEWFNAKIARAGAEIRGANPPPGPVLTLAPTIPLSARLEVYPEFCTGAFGWRSAHLVPLERRKSLHLVAPDDLAALLEVRPPGSLLTGVEEADEEQPLIDWAKAHAFTPVPLKKKRTLWLLRHDSR